MHYPIFSRNDLNAFWALFADNLANLLIISAVCRFVFQMPDEVVFGRILPGAGIAILFGVAIYVVMARRLARKENRNTVTALPYGISTPVMFVYLFGVIGPIYWATDDAMLAWQVGIAAGVIGGVVEMLGAVIGPWLQRVTPRAGMLGTLAGIALVFIATVAMARIYESPIIGFTALAFVLWGMVGRFKLPFNLPAGLMALVAGTLVALALGESSFTTEGLGWYPPLPYFGDLMVGLQYLWDNPALLSVLIPVQIYNFIETMNNVESAESMGDKYPVGLCQVTDGLGTMLGGLFGSPFPTTVYIGHPAYKRMRAGSGYALGVGLVFFIGALFGLIAFLGNLIPQAAVAPILVFVGVSIIASAFRSVQPRHHVAVAIAFLPHVSAIIVVKWNAALNALKDLGLDKIPALNDTAFVNAMATQGAHIIGQSEMAMGAILSGMLWGAFAAFLIDSKIREAVIVTLVAAVLTGFGVIHDPSLHWFQFDSPILWGYFILAVLMAAKAQFPLEQEEDHEPIVENTPPARPAPTSGSASGSGSVSASVAAANVTD